MIDGSGVGDLSEMLAVIFVYFACLLPCSCLYSEYSGVESGLVGGSAILRSLLSLPSSWATAGVLDVSFSVDSGSFG